MRVLQTIGGMNAISGGPSTCTYDLLKSINQFSEHPTVDLLTVGSTSSADRILGIEEGWFKSVDNDYKTSIAYSKNISKYLELSDYDIYHTNGLWMHVNHITCSTARKKNKPYIITTHGMLYETALKRGYWKKFPFLKLWFDKDIHNASCVHATCIPEMEEIRKFGYKGPIAVIGNPVIVPDYTESIFKSKFKVKGDNSMIKLGFLGRLHPIKRIENIIEALHQIKGDNIELFVIGVGSKEYELFLKNKVSEYGLDDRVHFLGFVSGKEKFGRLSEMNALIVPSDMENFGMIIPEALIVGTPVMASLGTPWKVLNDENCGWWTDNSPETIVKVIKSLIPMTLEQRIEMGKSGRDYILRTFAAEQVAMQMMSLYRWITGDVKKPDFVFTM